MQLLVDADACPAVIKETLYKTAERCCVKVILVANQFMRIPVSPWIEFMKADQGPDEADDRIVEITEPGDLIISADIPLADRVIKKGGAVLNPRGDFLTEANVSNRLASRDLMDSLRSEGLVSGGPKPFSDRERQTFANSLDRYITRQTADGSAHR